MKWKPPKKAGEVVAEDGLRSLWKLPNADVEEFKNVSEMPANVCEKIDNLLAVLATFSTAFKAAKIKSIVAARQHVEKGYDSAVRAAVVAGEAFDRKAAAEKGKTSGKESEDMGEDAKKKWAGLKQALLLTHTANFDLTFSQRYLELRIDEQGIPTAKAQGSSSSSVSFSVCHQT